jgi:hypothetical protein
MIKSCYCTQVHCYVVQAILNSTKQYESYCGIDNRSLTNLTVTVSQNCLKANKQYPYNKLICKEKHSHCLFSSEYYGIDHTEIQFLLTLHDINFFCGLQQLCEYPVSCSNENVADTGVKDDTIQCLICL